MKKGSLSINSENIFPIIKKWLYSDHDIFIRELVSNGCDAITKLKKLSLIGDATIGDDKLKVTVSVDSDAGTITFEDNGIGMTDEEVDKYINEIAFSGATAFLEEYKDKTTDDQIIGHFGLGFYSAFMVADRVTIDTLSYKEGAKAVYWDCTDGTDFEMKESDKETRGTVITLYLNDDSKEFAGSYRVKEVLNKYCSFMPVEIYLDTHEDDKEPELISDTTPLWTKHPNECNDEDYKEFYQKVFADYKEPLFWIHLNMDYPFNLKGILYFPKINMEYESAQGTIKLYNNQVFIADNIKEVIPEYLMLLKGVIDCPDLPLNVSRSALQNDGFVTKISGYITKKVADKLSGMCKVDRENYEKYWDDISPFIKYGCLRDEKFCEKMSDYILFKNIEGKYKTFKDCLEDNKERFENTIFYTNDPVQQSQYINLFKEENIDVIVLPDQIDQPFISQLEVKNAGVTFKRVDDDLSKEFSNDEMEADEELTKKVSELFTKAIGREIKVSLKNLKNENVSSMINLSEESRRMQDMMKMYGMGDPSMFGGEGAILTLNLSNNLVKYVIDNPEGEHTDLICKQLYDLAVISHAPLDPESMTAFIERSNKILELLAK